MIMSKIKTIDFEAHFYNHATFHYLQNRKSYPNLIPAKDPGAYVIKFSEKVHLYHDQNFIDRLCDIGEERIKIMDQDGLDMQVLSFSTPGLDSFGSDDGVAISLTRQANDELADAIKRHPDRFKGFAAVAPNNVKEGVKELERAINQLGFVGWLTHSNFEDGRYLDDKKYWPLLEAAESLNIPIYLHPTVPPMEAFGKYGFSLAGPAMGFEFDVALCMLRMILAGVFDQFPKLTIILGHLGETMPFLLERLDYSWTNKGVARAPGFNKSRPNLKKLPSEILLENTYVSTSGRFNEKVLQFVVDVMGEDRMLLATDYPYESLSQSMDFIRTSQLSQTAMEKLCFRNAKNFGIT